MRRRTGFSLVEVLAVIGVIVIVIGLLMPNLNQMRERGRRAQCITNLKSIGGGLQTYVGEPLNQGNYPTRYTQNVALGSDTTANAQSPTAIPYMLVRAGLVPLKAFVCPDDPEGKPQKAVDVEAYDFEPVSSAGYKVMTYSYAAPLKNYSGLDRFMRWPEQTAAASDTSPNVGKTKQTLAWSGTISDDQRRQIVPTLHGGGDCFNVLWADFHVSNETRADIGIRVANADPDVGNDCIFTGARNASWANPSDPNLLLNQDEYGSMTTTDCGYADHLNSNESYLWGPTY